MLAARDLTALNRLAAKGFRVVVEGQGVRHVVEPMDAAPATVQASGGGGLTCDEVLQQMGSA